MPVIEATRTIVHVGNVEIGGTQTVMIAGPCSVESYEQTLDTALAVQAAGAVILRGGAYKPRTSPYDFQGLGVAGLAILAQVREETGLPVVSEVLSTDDIEVVADHVDMLQVGARNMQNFALLRRLGQLRKPIRGIHPGWWKRPGRAVRARYPLLRPGSAQYPRPGWDGFSKTTQPIASDCRSFARHGQTRSDSCDVARCFGSRRRRPDCRSAP